MGLFTCISLLVVVAAYAHGSKFAAGTGCYDCNYAPSGFVKGYEDWAHGTNFKEVGYLRCALTSYKDRGFVYKNRCTSGRCYIRREENGMVYRGCADRENLPWDVNPDVNCKYQGPSKSLWWFCEGDACNKGQMGESEDRCGSPPAPIYDHTTAVETYDTPLNDPSYGDQDASYNGHLGSYGDHGGYKDQGGYVYADGNQGGYRHYDGYGGYAFNRLGHRLVGLSLHQGHGNNYNQYPNEVSHEAGYGEQTGVVARGAAREAYNPCDGHCYDNPSGLYEDPHRADHFIQCGCANKGGHSCTCCKPYYLSCPENTHFDDSKKVCTRPGKAY